LSGRRRALPGQEQRLDGVRGVERAAFEARDMTKTTIGVLMRKQCVERGRGI